MSTLPEERGDDPEPVPLSPPEEEGSEPPYSNGEGIAPSADPAPDFPSSLEPEPPEPPIFTYAPAPIRPLRFPNLGDLVVLGFLLGLGFIGAGSVTALALHFHLFGVVKVQEALTDIHYTLGSQVAWYCFTFLGCLLVFPLFWHTGFFRGVEWSPHEAIRLRWRLMSAAFACFVLAFVDSVLMPGPKEAPIDQVFKLPGAAVLLFLFGITLAPFFEELGFRGFLLPAFCTCFEWIADRVSGVELLSVDSSSRKRWPFHAVLIAAVVMAIPVAALWLAFKGQLLYYGLICFAWFSGLGAAWTISERRAQLPTGPVPVRMEPGTRAGWTVPTMALMSIYTSIPFAFMHGQQIGYSVGPFLLLVCVSMVLCWVRLSTRSVAASTIVHACYNLLLFATMAIASGGFRHLDKM